MRTKEERGGGIGDAIEHLTMLNVAFHLYSQIRFVPVSIRTYDSLLDDYSLCLLKE